MDLELEQEKGVDKTEIDKLSSVLLFDALLEVLKSRSLAEHILGVYQQTVDNVWLAQFVPSDLYDLILSRLTNQQKEEYKLVLITKLLKQVLGLENEK